MATADLPAPVGPLMMRSLSPAKAPLYFVPGEMNDRRATVNVVRRQSRVAQCREQRAHLSLRQLVAGLDRGFTRHSRGEAFVLRRCTGDTIARQRIQSFAQATLGVEPRVRHWNCVDDQSVSAKSLDLKSQSLEIFAILVEGFPLSRAEVKCQWQQQPLRRSCSTLERANELLVQHSFVRGMLVNQDQAVFVLESNVGSSQLKQNRDWLRRSCDFLACAHVFVFCVPVVAGTSITGKQGRVAIDLRAENLRVWIRRRLERAEAEARPAKTERCRAIKGSKRSPDSCLHRALDCPSISKAHLCLGRVHVHVDRFPRQCNVQEERRAYACDDGRTVRSLDGTRDAGIADCASVDGQKYPPR